MCHPYPGPACSEHAFDDYIGALRAYELAEDASMSLHLAQALRQKERIYDTTVRGQSALRRQIMELAPEDTGTLLLLEQRQLTGQRLREEQLEAYRISVNSKRQGLKQELRDAGMHGRYAYALGFAYAYLAQQYPTWELEIDDTASITMSQPDGTHHRVFVLPQKYQRGIGEAAKNDGVYSFPGDVEVEAMLNREAGGLDQPSASGRQALQAHLEGVLADGGYDLIAHVNTTGELVEIDTTADLFETIRVTARLQARQSGTSYYTGEPRALEQALRGSAFESGRVLKLEKPHRVIITGVNPQQKQACYVGPYFMSWRANTNSFVVKRRGGVVRESLLLKLQRLTPVLRSLVTPAAQVLLGPAGQRPAS